MSSHPPGYHPVDDHPDSALRIEVAAAIAKANDGRHGGPFGLFDYGGYGAKPHERYHVRDFREPSSLNWGRSVFVSGDRAIAEARWKRLCDDHVAAAAIAAVRAFENRPAPEAAAASEPEAAHGPSF